MSYNFQNPIWEKKKILWGLQAVDRRSIKVAASTTILPPAWPAPHSALCSNFTCVSEESKRSSICLWWQEWNPDSWHCKMILLELPFELREKYGNVFLGGESLRESSEPRSSRPSMTRCCTSSVNHLRQQVTTSFKGLQCPPIGFGLPQPLCGGGGRLQMWNVADVTPFGRCCCCCSFSCFVFVVFLTVFFVFTGGHIFIVRGVEVEAAPQPGALGSGHLWRELLLLMALLSDPLKF